MITEFLSQKFALNPPHQATWSGPLGTEFRILANWNSLHQAVGNGEFTKTTLWNRHQFVYFRSLTKFDRCCHDETSIVQSIPTHCHLCVELAGQGSAALRVRTQKIKRAHGTCFLTTADNLR